jgi:hypothetical protein
VIKEGEEQGHPYELNNCVLINLIPYKAYMVFQFQSVPSEYQTRGTVLQPLSLPCPEIT